VSAALSFSFGCVALWHMFRYEALIDSGERWLDKHYGAAPEHRCIARASERFWITVSVALCLWFGWIA
jgi:hypothetical protein